MSNVWQCVKMSTCDRDSCCKGPVEREVGTPVAYVTEVHLVENYYTERSLCKWSVCSCGNKCNREMEYMETLLRHHTGDKSLAV